MYRGTCGSLNEIDCNDDNDQGLFSTISLSGQTPGATLYVSVWKYDSDTDNGEFQVSAYDNLLATHNTSYSKENIQISPNPFTDQVTISNISEVKSISIIDISGKLTKVIEKPSSLIYLGELKQGLYLITLKMKDGTTKTIKSIKK